MNSQVTLPSMVTIPSDSPAATVNTSTTYAMTIYDQACLDKADSSNSSSSSSNKSDDDSSSDSGSISQWVQSQFIVYVGAVALNSNNTCEVVCQIQSLMSFSIMFGDDIRTRSVLIGRVYMSTIPDGTNCFQDSSNGTCSNGQCLLDDNEKETSTTLSNKSSSTETSDSEESTVSSTESMVSNTEADTTTPTSENQTTNSGGNTTTTVVENQTTNSDENMTTPTSGNQTTTPSS